MREVVDVVVVVEVVVVLLRQDVRQFRIAGEQRAAVIINETLSLYS